MNGVAVLSRDDKLNELLLANGFKQAKGRKRVFHESSCDISFILEHTTGILWIIRLFNNSITIRSHRDTITYDYDYDEIEREDLIDFLELSRSKSLKDLYRKDVEDKNITNANGGKIGEFCILKIKNDSKFLGEILSLVRKLKEKKTSIEELPSYIDNAVIIF